ncbi:tRNA (adenosine(37)-N6)-threonylcarbamoyltransferase complex dimerization subunit type 1 TsaB [Thiohalorhabdus methylotrophus]|uniref:tRNA threonylcarbamoyladenosine biosynthesis protein TsaB n=1 Tax=Thiohalorhabdus methylotrophus TaxID=3242694 RepID=A0ABV4TUS0_9GAMM
MSASLPPLAAPGPLLALAGASDATSVAVLLDGVLYHRSREGVAQHSLHLLPLVDELLSELALDRRALGAVAFARGPGPFTAGRIVVATAQGLGLGLGVPLVPVSSLEATAWASGRERTAVALEAGQGEVYWGAYHREPQGVAALEEERVLAPENAAVPGGEPEGWWGVGGGWRSHAEPLSRRFGPALAGIDAEIPVRADAVAALAVAPWREGRVLAAGEAVPTYLRASYAERPSSS